MRASTPFHYGWHIVWAGTLCTFASLGLGRFALGMLLPAMASSLSLSYAKMGLLSTMNFMGYLVAVLFCGQLTARFGLRRLIGMALLATGLSTIAISQTNGFLPIMLLYTVTGFSSGTANVPMVALLSAWFASRQRGKATGFSVIGSGFAILLSGKMAPIFNASGPEGWRTSWQVIGLVVLSIALICYAVLRDSPRDKGLAPYGQGAPGQFPLERTQMITSREIIHLGAIYFLFGATYVVYATFLVTTLIKEHGMSEAAAGNCWSLVGLLSLLSGPVFGTLSDSIGRRATLIIVFLTQSMSYFFIALPLPSPFLYLSIGCYGIVAWSIPSIMAALVGDYAGPEKVARIFGLVTFIFGLGQIGGPALAGFLAEQTRSFSGSFLMSGGLTLLAALLSAALARPERSGGLYEDGGAKGGKGYRTPG